MLFFNNFNLAVLANIAYLIVLSHFPYFDIYMSVC